MIRETKIIMMIEIIIVQKVTTAAGGAAASNTALASQLRSWEVAEEEILVKMIRVSIKTMWQDDDVATLSMLVVGRVLGERVFDRPHPARLLTRGDQIPTSDNCNS